MTKIEEKFFKVFGIKPYEFDGVHYYYIGYPQITSDILLRLICICSNYEPLNNYRVTLEELKNNCLEKLIELSDIDWMIKNEVQSLFEMKASKINEGEE